MTLQFDISAHVEQVREARAAGKGLCAFVIEGERGGCSPWQGHCCFAGCDPMPCGCCRRIGFHSPPEMVVPERFRAAAKCERCDSETGCDLFMCLDCGNEFDEPCERHASHNDELAECPVTGGCCPNCVGGVPVVELVAECSECYVAGWPVDELIECGSQFCTAGRVSLGRATVTVLPVENGQFRVVVEFKDEEGAK